MTNNLDNDSKRILDALQSSILDAAKTIKSNDRTFDTNTFPACKDQFRKLMNHYVTLANKHTAAEEAYRSLSDLIEVDDKETDQDDITAAFNNLIEKALEQYQTTNEPEAITNINRILSVDNDDIDELETEQPKTIPKDPISRKEINRAVKNNKCGHVYDKEGIESLFQQKEANNRKVRCPQIGCTNLDMKRDQIVDDEETNRLIEQIRLNQS